MGKNWEERIEMNYIIYFIVQLLLRIFQHVPSKDRRNSLRLVCRRWNQISEDRLFTSDEKIILIDNFSEEIFSVFQRSERSTFNLHFMRVNFFEFEKGFEFFISHGAKVQSLVFDNCYYFMCHRFTHIISLCPNVKLVSLLFDHTDDLVDLVDLVVFLKYLTLHAPNFTAKSVSSFSCRFYAQCKIVFDEMSTLLSCFPNLEELKIGTTHCKCSPCWYRNKIQQESVVRAISNYILTHNRNLKKLWLMQSISVTEVHEFPDVLFKLKK